MYKYFKIAKILKSKFYRSCTLIFLLSLSYSQKTSSVEGTVIDSTNGKTLSSVNILLKNSIHGVVTDETGNFLLKIPSNIDYPVLVIKHIGYKEKIVIPGTGDGKMIIALVPTVIQMKQLNVEGERRGFKQYDLANTLQVLDARELHSRGFVDVADALTMDQSIIVEESYNGKKTISLRGSAADEIVFLYDGFKINSHFDKSFDLSLIDPSGLEKIEIIKGSNVMASGVMGSAGVINFKPQIDPGYHLKLNQRFGTYNNGDWSLSLAGGVRKFRVFYNTRESKSTQLYAGNTEENLIGGSNGGSIPEFKFINNSSSNKSLNIEFPIFSEKKYLTFNYLDSSREYHNERDKDSLILKNKINNIKFDLDFGKLGNIKLYGSKQSSLENHQWNPMGLPAKRKIGDKSLLYKIDYQNAHRTADVYFSFESEQSNLDLSEIGSSIQPGEMQNYISRIRNSITAIFELKNESITSNVDFKDLRISINVESITDLNDAFGLIDQETDPFNYLFDENGKREWSEKSFMFSSSFISNDINRSFYGYLTAESSFRIPTMYQQMTYAYSPLFAEAINLLPEYKKNIEIGVKISDKSLNEQLERKYEVSFALFKNQYTNKFMSIKHSGSPITYIINYPGASISGVELNTSAYFFQHKVSLNLSHSNYFISDRAAFSFKTDKISKIGINFLLHGTNLNIIFFKENPREGWIVRNNGELSILTLEEFESLDIHFTQRIKFSKDLEGYISLSGRNLLNNEEYLEGIALRDKRIYLTLGFQL